MISNFHFLHPMWLLSLLPLAGILWLLYQKKASNNSAWSKVIDANLLPLLLKGSERKSSKLSFILLAIAWFISVVALADPVWEKIPRPVFQTNAARVIVLDLSRSMLIPDLKPSRLARARFKIEDILARNEEGQIGLVVFAGDGFTAAPLTRDTDTISSLLKVLKPNIMPAQGSRADLGLLKAHELLNQAGITNGHVLLIADGVVGNKAVSAAEKLNKDGYMVSVLAVGTEEGGLIPQLSQPINVKLETKALQAVAKAGGGKFELISNSNDDLTQLLNPLAATSTESSDQNADNKNKNNEDLQSQDWESNAPYLILLLLPLAAFAFRKGWLFNIVLVVGLTNITLQPQPAMAFSLGDSIDQAWTNLWERKDQQASKALQHKQYQQASKLAKSPLLKGSAEYKQGNYQQALEDFSKATGADADYNRGNTLAKLEKYEDAIKAYEKTLEQDTNHTDAKANKEAIEKLLKEKENKDKNQSDKQQKNGDKQSDENQQKQKENSEEGDQGDKQEQQDKNAENQNKSGGDQDDKKKDGQQGNQDDNNQFSDAAKQLEENSKNQSNQNAETQNQNKEEGEKAEENKAAQKGGIDKKGSQEQSDSDKKASLAETNSGTNSQADELTKEEKIAAEQWLRRIPDDPGGLLRRKFTRQYKQRHPQPRGTANDTNFW